MTTQTNTDKNNTQTDESGSNKSDTNSTESNSIEVIVEATPSTPLNTIQADDAFTSNEPIKKVPKAVEDRYLKVGDKFYNSKKPELLAFEDKGTRLETKANSEHIAESMVMIASERGWSDIKVTGTEAFRREVWLEASARGIDVNGYKPSEQDKALLEKRNQKTHFRGGENTRNQELAKVFSEKKPFEAAQIHPELTAAAAITEAIDKKARADGLNAEQRKVVNQHAIKNISANIAQGKIPNLNVVEKDQQQSKEQELER